MGPGFAAGLSVGRLLCWRWLGRLLPLESALTPDGVALSTHRPAVFQFRNAPTLLLQSRSSMSRASLIARSMPLHSPSPLLRANVLWPRGQLEAHQMIGPKSRNASAFGAKTKPRVSRRSRPVPYPCSRPGPAQSASARLQCRAAASKDRRKLGQLVGRVLRVDCVKGDGLLTDVLQLAGDVGDWEHSPIE